MKHQGRTLIKQKTPPGLQAGRRLHQSIQEGVYLNEDYITIVEAIQTAALPGLAIAANLASITCRTRDGDRMISISPKVGKAMAIAVDRGNDQRQQKLAIYRRAIGVIAGKRQWSNGETVTLSSGTLQGRYAEVFLKNESGELNLYLFREGETLMDRFYSSRPFTVGYGVPGGWIVSTSATEAAYLTWNFEVRQAMAAAQDD